jgi:hypothetical protein
MFEEVPCERHGLARLVPTRRVAIGPFVLGGGMLLATLGGSVAVAAAATVITASAIGSKDLPARPGHVVTNEPASPAHSGSSKRSPAHRPVVPPGTGRHSTLSRDTGRAAPAPLTSAPATARPAPATVGTTESLPRSAAPAAVPTPAGTTPAAGPSRTAAASSSAPLGNALIHVSGYDQASGRLAYQFATAQPQAGVDSGVLYRILDSGTFSAALAPSVTVISGGSVCPPAGSACTVDQLIRAAQSGFFAEAAIDAGGQLRSIVEVGGGSLAPKVLPAPTPSSSTGPSSSTPGGSRLVRPQVSSSAPAPSPTTTP